MDLSCSNNIEVATFARDFYFDLLKDEFAKYHNFRKMEIRTIEFVASNVDKNAHLADHDDPLMQLFSVHLTPRFSSDSLLNCDGGKQFLVEIAQLFRLLRALGRLVRCYDFSWI